MRGYVANRYASTLLEDGMTENLQRGAQSLLETAGVSPERAEAIAPFAAIIPEFVPGIGEAVGVDNTKRAAQEGNYGEALFEGAMTGLGSIPVIGDLAKYAIFAGLGARGANAKGAEAAIDTYSKDFGPDGAFDIGDPIDVDASIYQQGIDSRAAGNSRQSWFVGTDRMPRYEINDSGASINQGFNRNVQEAIYDKVHHGNGFSTTLGHLLNHDQLFKAYPQMRDMPLLFMRKEEDLGGSVASYIPPNPELLKQHPEFANGGIVLSIEDVLDGNRENLIGSVLHEAQHGIQEFEDFSRGSSNTVSPRDAVARHKAYGNPDSTKADRMMELIERAEGSSSGALAESAEEHLSNLFYTVNAGEAEARAVELRRRLNASERKARPPSMDHKDFYDVPDDMRRSLFDYIEMGQ